MWSWSSLEKLLKYFGKNVYETLKMKFSAETLDVPYLLNY